MLDSGEEIADLAGHLVRDQKTEMRIVRRDEIGGHDEDNQRHHKGGQAEGKIFGAGAHPHHGVIDPDAQPGVEPIQTFVDKGLHLVREIGQELVQLFPNGKNPALKGLPDSLPVVNEGTDLADQTMAQPKEDPTRHGKGQQDQQQGEHASRQAQPLLEALHQRIEDPCHHQGQRKGHEQPQQWGNQIPQRQHDQKDQDHPYPQPHPQSAPVPPG